MEIKVFIFLRIYIYVFVFIHIWKRLTYSLLKGDQIATLYDIQQKTVKPSLSSKSRYGFTQNKNNCQKPTRPVHETRAESLNSLRGARKVQKALNDL